MKTMLAVICAFSLSILAGACNEAAETPVPTESRSPANTEPIGTTGSSQAAANEQRDAAGTAGTDGELPDTASPLFTVLGAGLLALGGAAGIRAFRAP